MSPTLVYTNRLECVECGRVSRENERGWTAHLTAEDDGSEAVAIYCPNAATASFGKIRG